MSQAYGMGMGANPAFGRDSGMGPPGAGAITAAQLYYPNHYHQTMYYPHQNATQFYMGQYGYPVARYQTLPNGMTLGGRPPQNPPKYDSGMPAAQLANATGGVGLEPGYNYFFPGEHTKVHVLRTKIPPWQLPENSTPNFHATYVPTNVTIRQLLQGFGADNRDPQLNIVYEVTPAGGKWYKGLMFNESQEDKINKTIKEVGWDSSRSGLPGERDVVWLYITK